ncbi:hypothetical protein Tco_0056071 [Tanacetum coccineum]
MTGSGKQKQPATGLETLSEIALTETEQLKIAINKSTDEGPGDKPGVPDVPEHHSNSEEESWTFSDDDEDDDANKDSDAHDDEDDEANKDSDAHDDDDVDAT